jgi:hypothetical protein
MDRELSYFVFVIIAPKGENVNAGVDNGEYRFDFTSRRMRSQNDGFSHGSLIPLRVDNGIRLRCRPGMDGN